MKGPHWLVVVCEYGLIAVCASNAAIAVHALIMWSQTDGNGMYVNMHDCDYLNLSNSKDSVQILNLFWAHNEFIME